MPVGTFFGLFRSSYIIWSTHSKSMFLTFCNIQEQLLPEKCTTQLYSHTEYTSINVVHRFSCFDGFFVNKESTPKPNTHSASQQLLTKVPTDMYLNCKSVWL